MKNMIEWMLIIGAGASLAGCATAKAASSSVTKQPFGATPDGHSVELYTLRNAAGAEAKIMTYGGIVQSLSVADKNGKFGDVTLGYDALAGYIKETPYFGALVGRYGNRIGGAKFTLEGQTYTLATNNGPNTLHGGLKGFDKVVWKGVKAEVGPQGPQIELNYLSKDGEEGFPGNLNVFATYTLTDKNELRLEYTATTDRSEERRVGKERR